jgi:hypothetical protein
MTWERKGLRHYYSSNGSCCEVGLLGSNLRGPVVGIKKRVVSLRSCSQEREEKRNYHAELHCFTRKRVRLEKIQNLWRICVKGGEKNEEKEEKQGEELLEKHRTKWDSIKQG